MRSIVRGACHHDCPDTCVWDVTVEDGRAVRLRGNTEHPTTSGQLCPKVNRFLDRVYNPDRIRQPLARVGPKGGDAFEPISWDDAIARITTQLRTVLEEAGPSAVLPFSFDGTQGLVQKGVMADRFFETLGASDIKRHLCGVTAWLGASDVSGQPFGIDPEALQHAKSIILWGTNTLLTNRHLWPIIEKARAAGASITVIDPIRTPTADQADHFIQPRPGTDVAVVLGMIHIIERDGLLDDAWLRSATTDAESLLADARPMNPEVVASITGVDPKKLVDLAHRYATSTPSAIRVLVGPEHRQHGRDIMRAIALLPAVTGAWRHHGGGLARSTQIYFETALNLPDPSDASRRSFNMAALGRVLTDKSLDPPIAALFVHNSNPAVICPEQNLVVEGLEREDLFTVVIEQFMTDTARYADVVLPATTQVEHLDLSIAWGHLYLALNQPAIPPVGEALPNSEIFRRLAASMSAHDVRFNQQKFTDSDEAMVRQLLDSSHPWLDGISYESLQADTWQRLRISLEHRPFVDAKPDTADGRLQLGHLSFRAGHETVEASPILASRYPLTLLSRKQHPGFLNANYGDFPAHFPPAGEPMLEMHASDAEERAVESEDLVSVRNDRGSIDIRALISDRVQPGVVAMPFGWWHRQSPSGRGVNALTNPNVGLAEGDDVGSAAFHETLVEVVLIPETPTEDP